MENNSEYLKSLTASHNLKKTMTDKHGCVQSNALIIQLHFICIYCIIHTNIFKFSPL